MTCKPTDIFGLCYFSDTFEFSSLCMYLKRIVENKNLKRNCLLIPDSCQPQCGNGGVCIGHNLCSCPHGFSGPDCQDKTCTVHCENGGVCTMPDNKCKCRDGYYGARCHKK